MGDQDPVLVERIANLQADVSEIKLSMATKTDQQHTDRQINQLTAALAQERTERIAAIDAERAARSRAIAEEKRERVDADKQTAGRLQLVEDRLEARKYNVAIAILLSSIGAVLSLIFGPLQRALGG